MATSCGSTSAWTPPSCSGRAEQAGVTFIKGADFFPPGEGGERSARLAFSFVSPAEIVDGIGRLAALVPAAARV